MDDGLLQRVPGARVDVGLGEGALRGRYCCDRFRERAVLAMAALEDAGICRDQCGSRRSLRSRGGRRRSRRHVGSDSLRDLDDAAVGDGDFYKRLLVLGPSALTQEEIEGHVAVPA